MLRAIPPRSGARPQTLFPTLIDNRHLHPWPDGVEIGAQGRRRRLTACGDSRDRLPEVTERRAADLVSNGLKGLDIRAA